MSFEVELKLMFAPADLEALREDERFRALTGSGKTTVTNLRSVYFDTPGFTLSSAGIVARLRETGNGLIQTLKTPSKKSGIALHRGEYETAVPPGTAAPRFSLLPDEIRGQIEDIAASAPLNPIVETRVTRCEIEKATAQGGVILIAIDTGSTRSGELVRPLCEIELELRSGPPASLYELALEIIKLAPCTIGIRGKAERGFDLALGTRPGAVHASDAMVSADMNIEDAYIAILDNCLGQFVANLPAVMEESDPTALHQMRVSLRRLRSALELFSDAIRFPGLKAIEKDAQYLARLLGKARDLDVFLSIILPPAEEAFPGDTGLAALRDEVSKEQKHAWHHVIRILSDRRTTRFVLRLALALEEKSWRGRDIVPAPEPATGFAASSLDQLMKKVASLGSNLKTLDTEDRHDLRKRLKRLRYNLSFFQAAFPEEKVQPFLASLSKLQTLFGKLNDIVMSEAILAHVEKNGSKTAARAGAARLRKYHHKTHDTDMKKTMKLWREFRNVPPFWQEKS